MKKTYSFDTNWWQCYHLSRWLTCTLLLLLIVISSTSLRAQVLEKVPGKPVICPAKYEDQFTKANVPDEHGLERMRTGGAVQTATFEITFGSGAQANPDAQAAFEFALDIWATQIVSPIPIKVFADFADLGPGVLASAGPAYNVRNFPNAPEPDVFYPAALANALAGEVLFPDEEFDLIVNLGNGVPYYFGLDGNTPAGQFDFVTVALHEAGHGLGFTTIRSFNNGVGSLRSSGSPSIFAIFIEDGDGNRLIDFPDPSTELGDAFTGGDIFMAGTFAVAALGGVRPALFAPPTWAGGSSLAHWDEATFPAGDPNSLMTPQVGTAEANFDIGDITRGLFRDMGWVLNDDNAPPLVVTPTQLSEELSVGNTNTQSVEVSNIADEPLNFTVSTDPEATWLSFTLPTLPLASAATGTLEVQFDASGLVKGVYEAEIVLTIDNDAATEVRIPVSLRVLDGTEVPAIEVDPTSLSAELQQLQQETQTLTISNVGDDDLTFSVVINDAEGGSFSESVATSNKSINENGFEKVRYGAPSKATSLASLTKISETYDRLVTTLYATGFEDFAVGELNGQLGWQTQFPGNWVVSDANPFEGTQHLLGISDGLGSTRDGAVLALSPTIAPGSEPFTVASARIAIEGEGVTWEFIPQSPTAESVVTRVAFNPDRSVSILEEGGFVPLNGVVTPEGYFNIRLVVDRDDATYSLFFDDELVYAGQGFAAQVEQIVFLSLMEVEGSTFRADNIEINDGDADAFFLSVTPSAGTVPFGATTDLAVKFDARALEPGEYAADIVINSNDANNPEIVVPATLTVTAPPTIEVTPDNLQAAVNVQVDDPPSAERTFTITNTGSNPLEFSTGLGATNFTPPTPATNISVATLDMARYGVGNTAPVKEALAGSKRAVRSVGESLTISGETSNSTAFVDSIFYDSGVNVAGDFAGVQTAPYTSAIKFDVETASFTLNAVRNAFRTETVANPTIILEIYRGGTTPADGELLLSQTLQQASEEGAFVVETLDEAFTFAQGESFWVVHKYPDGIEFPQGVDDGATQRPDTYFFSSDGGSTYNPSGFVFLVRALSGGAGSYITLNPATGTVTPGESVEVTATFDAAELANGTYETDIVVTSNDPVNPETAIATVFDVSGQVAAIEVSEEALLFNDVFIGASRERTFTISNTGLSQLNVTSITSDNSNFTVDNSNVVIAAGGSAEITVTFAPSTTGNINGIVTIQSDAANNAEQIVVVSGVGSEPPIASITPEEVSLTTNAGTTIDATFTLKNEGNEPLFLSFPDLAVVAALAQPDVQLNNTAYIDFASVEQTYEKGSEDNRVGNPVTYSVGTDNGFGYMWIDSDEPNGPVYSFTDIAVSGTEISTLTGGDGTVQVDLPFTFSYFSETYSSVFINANGFVAFEQPTGSTFINTQLPQDDTFNGLVAGLWTDLEPQNENGALHFESLGDRFVIQWTDVPVFLGSADETVTFQIVLYENGNIDIFYEDVASASFTNTATVGIESPDASDGAQVAFNTDYVKDNLALRFVRPLIALTPFISDVSPLSGVVPAGGERVLTVTADATELNDGVYFDRLNVSTNDPVNTEVSSLIELTVIGFPEIAVTPMSLDFEPLFIGLSSEASFSIENVGTKTLEISSIANSNDEFSIDLAGPLSLEPDQSVIVNVVYTPSTIGAIEDDVVIVSNDAFDNETAIVSLSGIGVDPPIVSVSPESIDVTVFEGQTATESVTITNQGASDLNYAVSPPFFASTGTELATAKQYEFIEYEKLRSKQQEDDRIGPTFLNASGGPGTFGYTWVDNNSGGPAYEFIDISESGTRANVVNDGDEEVALPFDFPFFGGTENSVTIAANGFLTFTPIVGANFVNTQIPSNVNPDLFIAPLWDDLEPDNGGGVFYQATADYFIVQYEAVPGFGFPPLFPVPDPVTFQVILFPDGSIKMQYENVNSTIATSGTVGLEGPLGLSGLQVIFNNEYLEDELAITFTPPTTGTVAPGASVEVPVTFNENDQEVGTYEGNLFVSSNDPQTPRVEVSTTLEVLPLPEVVDFSLINATTNEVIGALREGDIINLDDYPDSGLSIVANVSSVPVGSVVFDFNGETNFQRENVAPYALGGDRNSGEDFNPVTFPLGINTVTATPFTERNATGVAGTALTITFEVANNQALICFGESVVNYAPGNKKNGGRISTIRSNPSLALDAPQENDTFNFVSLGFGGSVTIEMGCEVIDREGNDLRIIETSFRDPACDDYPEKAKVEASIDGETWVVLADEICRSGEVDLAAGGLTSARFVRVTDVSNPADFNGNADGYDVDGIMVINPLAGDMLVARSSNAINLVANEEADLVAYPNPVIDVVKLSLDGSREARADAYSTHHEDALQVNVYGPQGGLVYQQSIKTTNGTIALNLAKLPAGIYHVVLIDESEGIISRSKLIKQ
ncbi:MAG: choice-of-anchor D domain-containing protein [Thermonemataceae bacterium]